MSNVKSTVTPNNSLLKANEIIQEKTFRAWINLRLKHENLHVQNIFYDLRSGIILLKLLETISGEKLPKPNIGTSKIQWIGNIHESIKFLNKKVYWKEVAAEDIVMGNRTLTLNFVLHIIYYDTYMNLQKYDNFTIQDLDYPDYYPIERLGLTMKDKIMAWVMKRISGYPYAKVTDFHLPSWRNGYGFNAIIHSYYQNLFEYSYLFDQTDRFILNSAFFTAEKVLGVARILDADDFESNKMDEFSIFTYISLLYSHIHAFFKETDDNVSTHVNQNISKIDDKKENVEPRTATDNIKATDDTIESTQEQLLFESTYTESKEWMTEILTKIDKIWQVNVTIDETFNIIEEINKINEYGIKFMDDTISTGDYLKTIQPSLLYKIAEQQGEISDLWELINNKANEIIKITKKQQSDIFCQKTDSITNSFLEMKEHFEKREDVEDLRQLKKLFKTHENYGKLLNEPNKIFDQKTRDKLRLYNPELYLALNNDLLKYEEERRVLKELSIEKQLWLEQRFESHMFYEEAKTFETNSFEAFEPTLNPEETTSTIEYHVKKRKKLLVSLKTIEERLDAFMNLKTLLASKKNFPKDDLSVTVGRVLEIVEMNKKEDEPATSNNQSVTDNVQFNIVHDLINLENDPVVPVPYGSKALDLNQLKYFTPEIGILTPIIFPTSPKEEIISFNSIFDNLTKDTKPLKVIVKKSTKFYDRNNTTPTYRTRSKKRGVVLIVNNNKNYEGEETRKGSEKDVENLEELFKQMHMTVQTHSDVTIRDLSTILDDFVKNELLLTEIDMCFVIVMSHGTEGHFGTGIECKDGYSFETKFIEEKFENKSCPCLQNKPKVFIYQVCRGDKVDRGVQKHTNVEKQDDVQQQPDGQKRTECDSSNKLLRTRDNILIAHSTLAEYKSHRDIYLGSWYIQLLCEVFMSRAHDTHIEDMLKIVDFKLSQLKSEDNKMQTSTFANEGFKNCYIHPGIYFENNEIKSFDDNDN